MSDRHKHRMSTLSSYNQIYERAKAFLALYPNANMNEFCKDYGYSRRQVQRALSHKGTSWRTMKKNG